MQHSAKQTNQHEKLNMKKPLIAVMALAMLTASVNAGVLAEISRRPKIHSFGLAAAYSHSPLSFDSEHDGEGQ
jgi:hypothetical protein